MKGGNPGTWALLYNKKNHLSLERNCSHPRAQRVWETMSWAKTHQHQSLYHTGRNKNSCRRTGRKEKDRYSNTALSAPLPSDVIPHHCSGHGEDKWLLCQEHGTEGRVAAMMGALMGHEMYRPSLTSAPTAAEALHGWQPVKSKRKPDSAEIIGKEIAWEAPLQY